MKAGTRRPYRHTAHLTGNFDRRYLWLSIKNPQLWGIGIFVTAALLAVFWMVKDIPMLPGKSWSLLEKIKPWKQTFFMTEKQPVTENGKVVRPGEKEYTVPSELVDPK